MARKIQVLVELNVSRKTIYYLARRNFDIQRLDMHWHRMPDEGVYNYARENGRMLISHDRDFLDYIGHDSPGVVVLPQKRGRGGRLKEALEHFTETFCDTPWALKGTLLHYQRNGTLTIVVPSPKAPGKQICREYKDAKYIAGPIVRQARESLSSRPIAPLPMAAVK